MTSFSNELGLQNAFELRRTEHGSITERYVPVHGDAEDDLLGLREMFTMDCEVIERQVPPPTGMEAEEEWRKCLPFGEQMTTANGEIDYRDRKAAYRWSSKAALIAQIISHVVIKHNVIRGTNMKPLANLYCATNSEQAF